MSSATARELSAPGAARRHDRAADAERRRQHGRGLGRDRTVRREQSILQHPVGCRCPCSRRTRLVAASSRAETLPGSSPQRCPGWATTSTVSWATTTDPRSSGRNGVSMKPRSAKPARTDSMTTLLFSAVSCTIGPSSPVRMRHPAIHSGSRCSAMVRLAAIRIVLRRSVRRVATASENSSAERE